MTIDGTLDLSNGGTTTVTDKGLILKGVGGVGPGLADVQGAQLLFQGTQTLDNATIAIGDGAVYADDTDGGGAVLTLGANLTITQTGLTAQLSSKNYVRQNLGDAIINLGRSTQASATALST